MRKIVGAVGAALLLTGVAGARPQEARPAASTAPVPLDVFAELPVLESPALSPDGLRLATKQPVGGTQTLAVVSLFDERPTVRLGASAGTDINWWRWVNDEWLVVGIGSTTVLYGEEYYITRVLGIRSDMAKTVRLSWDSSGLRADDVLWIAKDGSPRILLSRQTGIEKADDFYPSVFEVDVSTGKSRRVAAGQPNVYQWFADGTGNVRAGYRYNDDTRTRTLLYRASNAEPFRAIARAKRDEEGMTIPLTFRDDGTAIAFDEGEDGLDAVYQVSLPDLKPGKKLYGLEGYDVDAIIDNAGENDVAGVRVTDRYERVVWLDPTLKEMQDAVDKSIGDRRARITSWSRDRTRFLLEVGTPSQAGAIYYWNTEGNRLQRIAYNVVSLKDRRLSPVSTIRYQARDGTPIEAVLTMPRHRAGAKNLPLIVMPHGGPFARDAEGWDWWTQFLAEKGYVVVQPNYRGSSGYGDAFARKGEGEWGLKMQDDLDDAVTHLARQGVVDAKRVCMVGASYGGYAAMRAAQRDGSRYRCAVSYAGVSDLAAMKRYDSQFLNGKTRADWLKKQAPDFRSVSPRFGAPSFGAPILLVHGKEDKRVPVKQSRMLAEELRKAGKPFEYLEQPLADHHFTRGEDRLEFLKRLDTFLDKHNPA